MPPGRREGGYGGQGGVGGAAALDCRGGRGHEERGEENRAPLDFEAEVGFVVGVPGFKSAEERPEKGDGGEVLLEAAVAEVFAPGGFSGAEFDGGFAGTVA